MDETDGINPSGKLFWMSSTKNVDMAIHGNSSHMMDYRTDLIVHLILLKFSVPNNLLEQKSLDNIALKMLMTRFELETKGVGSDCSDNYSTACAKLFSPITLQNLIAYKIASKLFVSKHLLEFVIYSGIATGMCDLKRGLKDISEKNLW